MFAPRPPYIVPLPRDRALHLGERPLVMGILNVSPDSFAESVVYPDAAAAVARGLELVRQGADIVDVGGESTRPGTDAVDAEEELRRVLPVVAGLAQQTEVPISIDTTKAVVARDAIRAGASIVNDISGLLYDSGLAGVVAEAGAALVLMHMRGRPKTMYAEAVYRDLVGEVTGELRERIAIATGAGVSVDRIIVDPGIGFAKRPLDSYAALAHVAEIAAALGRPILVGPSRKSFMNAALDGRPPVERDWGTAAAVTAAVLAGAHVVRVHAVAEMVQVVRVAEAIRVQDNLR